MNHLTGSLDVRERPMNKVIPQSGFNLLQCFWPVL
jgi:hypothetical protein